VIKQHQKASGCGQLAVSVHAFAMQCESAGLQRTDVLDQIMMLVENSEHVKPVKVP